MSRLDNDPELLQRVEESFLFGPEMTEVALDVLRECGTAGLRVRQLARVMVVQLILFMSVWRQHSVSNVITTVLAVHPGLAKFADASFYRARCAIGPYPLQRLFEKLAAAIQLPAAYLWKGLRLLVVDGTSLNLHDTAQNETVFGKPKCESHGESRQASYPQLKLVAIMCPILKAILHAIPDRYNGGERTKALHLIRRLGRGCLLLLDSGFAGAPIFKACFDNGVRFVCRIACSWKPRFIKQLGEGDTLIEVQGRHSHAYVRLQLRLIEFPYKGQLCRLITDLVDPIEYPKQDIMKLYKKRWEQEVGYGYLKTRLAGPAFGNPPLPLRGKSPEMVLQELYALLIVYNGVCKRMLLIAEARRQHVERISFVKVLTLVRLEALGFVIGHMFETLPIMRPRRPRSYPRQIKNARARRRYPERTAGYQETRWERPVDSTLALSDGH